MSKVTNFWLTYVKLYNKESTVRDSNGDQSDKGDQFYREQVNKED